MGPGQEVRPPLGGERKEETREGEEEGGNAVQPTSSPTSLSTNSYTCM